MRQIKDNIDILGSAKIRRGGVEADTLTAQQCVINGAVVENKHATTKQYVDNEISTTKQAVTQETDTKIATTKQAVTQETDAKIATTKQAVTQETDAKLVTKADKITVDNLTTTVNTNTTNITNLDKTKVSKSGDETISGNKTFVGNTIFAHNVMLDAKPTEDNHATTKNYVDNLIASKRYRITKLCSATLDGGQTGTLEQSMLNFDELLFETKNEYDERQYQYVPVQLYSNCNNTLIRGGEDEYLVHKKTSDTQVYVDHNSKIQMWYIYGIKYN